MRGATTTKFSSWLTGLISTHTPHAGRDDLGNGKRMTYDDFYSHAPCGARLAPLAPQFHPNDFYSHAPCGARPAVSQHFRVVGIISTHTPHAGRDWSFAACKSCCSYFYSHAPCGARRFFSLLCSVCTLISTHTPHAGRDSANRHGTK